MATQFAVLTVEQDSNKPVQRVRLYEHVPTTPEGTVLLDACPAGTMEVYGPMSLTEAAKKAGISPSTARRHAAVTARIAREEADQHQA